VVSLCNRQRNLISYSHVFTNPSRFAGSRVSRISLGLAESSWSNIRATKTQSVIRIQFTYDEGKDEEQLTRYSKSELTR